jgi:hypothetical protein
MPCTGRPGPAEPRRPLVAALDAAQRFRGMFDLAPQRFDPRQKMERVAVVVDLSQLALRFQHISRVSEGARDDLRETFEVVVHEPGG